MPLLCTSCRFASSPDPRRPCSAPAARGADDQLKTSFSDAGRAAVEARGIILRYPTWEVVCYPFDKFFNAGEASADELDWTNVRQLQQQQQKKCHCHLGDRTTARQWSL